MFKVLLFALFVFCLFQLTGCAHSNPPASKMVMTELVEEQRLDACLRAVPKGDGREYMRRSCRYESRLRCLEAGLNPLCGESYGCMK